MGFRFSVALLVGVALATSFGGCLCRKGEESTTPPADASGASMADAPFASPIVDLHLQRRAIVGYGNTTPLPVSPEFSEEVPEVRPLLERVAKERGGAPIRIRVERDVPYGQLTRLMQAGLGYRIGVWELYGTRDGGGFLSVQVAPPGPLPRGFCYATAWIGPDAKVQVGMDRRTLAYPGDAETHMFGTVVWPSSIGVATDHVLALVRKLDGACTEGQMRIYAQPTGTFGPAFDLALAFAEAKEKPHLSKLLFAVPSLGPMDTIEDVIK